MKNLRLNLIKKWFDMIESGEKTEEYRDISVYWYIRLVGNTFLGFNLRKSKATNSELNAIITQNLGTLVFNFKKFETVHFENGWMRKDGTPAPEFTIELKKIRIGTGRLDWGAIPEKKYFILELGTKKTWKSTLKEIGKTT